MQVKFNGKWSLQAERLVPPWCRAVTSLVFPDSPKKALPKHCNQPGVEHSKFSKKKHNKKECGLYGHHGAGAICSPKTLAFNDVDFKAAVPIDHCTPYQSANENALSEPPYIPFPQKLIPQF